MKKVKEEIIEEIANLKQDNQEWADANERRRKEFAKAFGWISSPGFYNDEPKISSWEQIFVEVGKLLASRNFMNYESNIFELENRLNELEKKIRNEIHPNL